MPDIERAFIVTDESMIKLGYIDKILYEWKKKGIKNASDVEKDRSEYRKKQERETCTSTRRLPS